MRLRFTSPALGDLRQILDYLHERSPAGAEKVRARFEVVLALLLERPLIGRVTDVPHIRRLRVTPFQYLIFYEVAGNDVVVHAVRHAAQDPSSMPG